MRYNISNSTVLRAPSATTTDNIASAPQGPATPPQTIQGEGQGESLLGGIPSLGWMGLELQRRPCRGLLLSGGLRGSVWGRDRRHETNKTIWNAALTVSGRGSGVSGVWGSKGGHGDAEG